VEQVAARELGSAAENEWAQLADVETKRTIPAYRAIKWKETSGSKSKTCMAIELRRQEISRRILSWTNEHSQSRKAIHHLWQPKSLKPILRSEVWIWQNGARAERLYVLQNSSSIWYGWSGWSNCLEYFKTCFQNWRIGGSGHWA